MIKHATACMRLKSHVNLSTPQDVSSWAEGYIGTVPYFSVWMHTYNGNIAMRP